MSNIEDFVFKRKHPTTDKPPVDSGRIDRVLGEHWAQEENPRTSDGRLSNRVLPFQIDEYLGGNGQDNTDIMLLHSFLSRNITTEHDAYKILENLKKLRKEITKPSHYNLFGIVQGDYIEIGMTGDQPYTVEDDCVAIRYHLIARIDNEGEKVAMFLPPGIACFKADVRADFVEEREGEIGRYMLSLEELQRLNFGLEGELKNQGNLSVGKRVLNPYDGPLSLYPRYSYEVCKLIYSLMSYQSKIGKPWNNFEPVGKNL